MPPDVADVDALALTRSAEKQFVERILALAPIAVAKAARKAVEYFHFLFRYLQTDQDAADIAALAAIMEQADISSSAPSN